MTIFDNNIPNIQVYPSKKFKLIIDNLTQKMFEIDIDGKSEISFDLVESHLKNITSSVKISNLNSLNTNFGEFEYAVFDATVSERLAGNEYTTAAILCRHLGCSHTPSAEIQKAVINSLEKLASIRIVANLDGTQKFYHSPIGDFEFRGYLLSSESLQMSINGQFSTIIHFLSKGPVFGIAEMKDQIITTDPEFMHAPVRTTVRTIAINHFLLRRILTMKGSYEASKTNKRVNPLRHTILLDSLYKACDITGNRAKQQSREIIDIILNFFVGKILIKSFSYETGNGGKIRAIKFNF
jgi:hypothetical protein